MRFEGRRVGRGVTIGTAAAILTSCTTARTSQIRALYAEVRDIAPVLDLAPSRGVAWGDVDDDGDPDLYVARSSGYRSMLYRNDDGQFVAMRSSPLSVDIGDAEGVAWVDLDGDGDLDFYAVTRSEVPALLFRNDGGWSFVPWRDSVLTSPRRASMACFADVDQDRDLDVFIAGYRGFSNVLALNDGAGRFTPISLPESAVGSGDARTCAWGDLENDGLPDLFIGNALRANVLLQNRGGGTFRTWENSHLSTHVDYTYGSSWADVDDDGDLDLFVASFDGDNVLYLNDRGLLRPLAAEATPQSAASKGHTWGDFDLSGTLDLYLGSGTPGPQMVNALYLGIGNGAFRRVGDREPWLLVGDTSAGIASADYDGDGDLDIFVANWGSERSPDRLYQAQVDDRSWVVVSLRGTDSNSHGIGARVSVLFETGGERRWRHRTLQSATGYAGQDDGVIHFGLGDAMQVDSLVVLWPSGRVDRYGPSPARQRLVITENGADRVQSQ